MRHTEGVFDAGGGFRLFWQRWCPDDEALAVLLIAHGFGEHSGRYQAVAARAIREGIAVYAWDHRGHGKSPGRRGHIDGMSDYRSDIDAFINHVSGMEPGLPLFVWGHSTGALIVLDRAIRNSQQIRSVITSSAALEPAGVASRRTPRLAKTLSRVWPTFPMRVPLNPASLSRDADEVNDFVSDPLVHNKATARWTVSMLRQMKWLKLHANEVRLPILMLHGEADRINLPMGSKRFFVNVALRDKQLKTYPNAPHALHCDLDKDTVIADLFDWILSHSRKPR